MSVTVSHLDGLESRQQRMWASGDYAAVAARIRSIALGCERGRRGCRCGS